MPPRYRSSKRPAGEDAQAEHHVNLPAHVAGRIQPRVAGGPHRICARTVQACIYRTRADVKRALPPAEMGQTLDTSASVRRELKEAQIWFALLFLLRGMPFADLARLRKCDFKDGNYLLQTENGRQIRVHVTAEAAELIRQCADRRTGSPLPAQHTGDENCRFPLGRREEYRHYQQVLRSFNRKLKLLATALGLRGKLSSYTARHTWATTAFHTQSHRGSNKQRTGHSSVKVTETYLKPFIILFLFSVVFSTFSELALVWCNFVSHLFLKFDTYSYICSRKNEKGIPMARVKNHTKVKEPIRLRMKSLSNGSKSLYLDIYRDGKRTYEYLKMYIIPETDSNSRRQNQTTMDAANAIKSKRIIELTSNEAGIVFRKDKTFLLDWMQVYMEAQESAGKKDGSQIKIAMRILKDYAGEMVTLDQIDGDFCRGYITYLLTEYHPKGKDISNYTLHNYYRALNGALNSAVRKKKMKANPFNELEKSEKIRKPESMRSYMTIEEVQALIDTPMPHEEYEIVKCAYLFSCFCGLRISDIIKLKWNDVFVDRGQYRLAVSMKKTKEPIYLPLSPEALKWMPERGGKSSEDNVFDLPSANTIRMQLKPWAKAAGISSGSPTTPVAIRLPP